MEAPTNNIKIRLSSTIGQQLFQIAAGYIHALTHNTTLCVDYDVAYYLRDVFEQCPIIQHKSHDLELFKTLASGEEIKRVGELFIDGDFQDLTYFDSRRSDVKKLFAPLVPPVKERTLGIHIRAGEMYTVPDLYRPIDATYIRTALRMLDRRNIDSITIFSDDNMLAQKLVRTAMADLYEWDSIPVRYYPSFNAREAFSALTGCDYLIMSNSAFSWWAAYLGKHSRVIMPPAKHYEFSKCKSFLPEWEVADERKPAPSPAPEPVKVKETPAEEKPKATGSRWHK